MPESGNSRRQISTPPGTDKRHVGARAGIALSQANAPALPNGAQPSLRLHVFHRSPMNIDLLTKNRRQYAKEKPCCDLRNNYMILLRLANRNLQAGEFKSSSPYLSVVETVRVSWRINRHLGSQEIGVSVSSFDRPDSRTRKPEAQATVP